MPLVRSDASSPDRTVRGWLFAVAGVAWATMLLQGARLLPPPNCLAADSGAGGRFSAEAAAFLASPLLLPTLATWLTMVAAMMAPLLAGPLGHVAVRSFEARRGSAIGLFLIGYAASWAAAFVLILILIIGLRSAGISLAGPGAALVYLLAAFWQGTDAKRGALFRCHRPIDLRPFGRSADLDSLRYGLVHGRHCVAACWALMAAPILAGHDLGAMAMLSAIVFAERHERRPQIRMSQLLLLGLAGLAWLAG